MEVDLFQCHQERIKHIQENGRNSSMFQSFLSIIGKPLNILILLVWMIVGKPTYGSLILLNFTCVKIMKKFFVDIVPKKVVLVGDSAGGNLVGALTLLAIKTGVRVPDGILMAYPALNLKY